MITAYIIFTSLLALYFYYRLNDEINLTAVIVSLLFGWMLTPFFLFWMLMEVGEKVVLYKKKDKS